MKCIVLIFSLLSSTLTLAAPVDVDDSIYYITTRLPYLKPGLSRNNISIKRVDQTWSEVCVVTADECFLLSKTSNGSIGFFDQLAGKVKKAMVVFQRVNIDGEDLTLKRLDKTNFGVLVDDEILLSEVFRNIQSYSKSTIPTLFLAERSVAKQNPTIRWFQGYLPASGNKWIPASEAGALIGIGGFSQRSPEVFDATAVTFLEDAQAIKSVPRNFLEDGVLRLMPWSMIVGTVIEHQSGNVLADRIQDGVLPRGPLNIPLHE